MIPLLRSHFQSFAEWRTGFGRFGDDASVRALVKQGKDLQRLRNHVAFHMLEMVPKQSLPKLPMSEYVIASGSGPSNGNVYYDLADTVAAHYVCGCPTDGRQFETALLRIGTGTRDLAARFLESGDMLMRGALKRYKVRLKVGPSTECADLA